jgi:uncharacterized pyridoxal phosphate-containing UPF0001 family protein
MAKGSGQFKLVWLVAHRELRDQLATLLDWPFTELSMGMSHDFEVAIEEGATQVRIGTALFGNRPSAK